MDDLQEAYNVLDAYIKQEGTKESIEKAIAIMAQSLKNRGKILTAGNGGSMCDALHFAEELSGRYRDDRPSYAAIAICDPSHLTCVGNDYGFDAIFSRFIEGVGFAGDVFLGISTSGNSKNVLYACQVARYKAMKTIALTGREGGKIKNQADICIIIPEQETYRIQEYHLPVYHALCAAVENEFFG